MLSAPVNTRAAGRRGERPGPRLFAAALLLLAGPLHSSAISFWDEVDAPVLVERLLDAMTTEELIAQTLLLGWTGQDPSRQILDWIDRGALGGVKVFGWNGTDLPRLARAIGRMQAVASEHRLGIPLLVATDQEGGWVRHVKGSGDLTTAITPGNMAIGATRLPFDAYQSALLIAAELRTLGINLNFAPTVDVYVNPEAHVIGPRAFSSDPVSTGLLGVAYFHGLERMRVIGTAKHYPGHGNAVGDSHGVLPVLQDTWDDLWARDLVPYRFLIGEGVPVVLSGHLNFPQVTGDGRPASVSSHFMRTVLRGVLGFRGVAITDDMYMGGAAVYAARQGWDFEQLVVEALRAGNDMVMLSSTPAPQGSIMRRLVATCESDPEFRNRVREAAGRVLQLKLEYLKPSDRVPLQPDIEDVRLLGSDAQAAAFFRDQAARSVTLVRDAMIPFEPAPGERLLVAGKDQDFLELAREYYPQATLHLIESRRFESSAASDRTRFRAAAARHDTVIFGLSDPASLEVLQSIRDLDIRVLVFSVLTPVYVADLPWVDSALAVYGWGSESYRAGFSVLTGAFRAEGVLPIPLGADGAE